YMQAPDLREQNMRMAELSPQLLLDGDTPRLIDEWQDAPSLWDAIRFEVDRRDEFGQFILTGSSVPVDVRKTAHSGTGRIARMRMRPMSLLESQDSSGSVSLKDMFAGKQPIAQAQSGTIDDLAFLVCRGGWPKAIGQKQDVALQQAIDYVDALTSVDISRVDGVNRNEASARALLRSYARFSSSQGTLESIRNDMDSVATLGESAFSGYIEALRRLFVIDDLEAWSPNLRSRTAIRTSPTRHFVDPSIAAAALGASPANLIADLNTFGLLFESMCVRDLRIYSSALGGSVAHYRDKSGLEVDAVVHLRNGSYGFVEIKLGGESAIEQGAQTLKKIMEKIDQKRMSSPAFLMVLVGLGDFSYCREDGVMVVPIRALGV
ncbi:MAG: ATP-binding protein, partial [Alloprevotella tannerae]|nr:ATP-binding protein [Alloprevotella tannerae]